MTKKWIAGTGLIPVVGIIGVLAGCDRFQSSPGGVCSAPATYDILNNILASTVAPDDRSHMLDRLKALVAYKTVTVDAVDKDTGKVSCGALLNFVGSAEGVKAISGLFALNAIARSSDPSVDRAPIEINDQDASHVSFQIHYTVQKARDSSQSVVMLDQARFLAQVIAEGVSAADKPTPATSAPAASPPDASPVTNDDVASDDNAATVDAPDNETIAPDNSANPSN